MLIDFLRHGLDPPGGLTHLALTLPTALGSVNLAAYHVGHFRAAPSRPPRALAVNNRCSTPRWGLGTRRAGFLTCTATFPHTRPAVPPTSCPPHSEPQSPVGSACACRSSSSGHPGDPAGPARSECRKGRGSRPQAAETAEVAGHVRLGVSDHARPPPRCRHREAATVNAGAALWITSPPPPASGHRPGPIS